MGERKEKGQREGGGVRGKGRGTGD